MKNLILILLVGFFLRLPNGQFALLNGQKVKITWCHPRGYGQDIDTLCANGKVVQPNNPWGLPLYNYSSTAHL